LNPIPGFQLLNKERLVQYCSADVAANLEIITVADFRALARGLDILRFCFQSHVGHG
jgi:hypothetical protein